MQTEFPIPLTLAQHKFTQSLQKHFNDMHILDMGFSEPFLFDDFFSNKLNQWFEHPIFSDYVKRLEDGNYEICKIFLKKFLMVSSTVSLIMMTRYDPDYIDTHHQCAEKIRELIILYTLSHLADIGFNPEEEPFHGAGHHFINVARTIEAEMPERQLLTRMSNDIQAIKSNNAYQIKVDEEVLSHCRKLLKAGV